MAQPTYSPEQFDLIIQEEKRRNDLESKRLELLQMELEMKHITVAATLGTLPGVTVDEVRQAVGLSAHQDERVGEITLNVDFSKLTHMPDPEEVIA